MYFSKSKLNESIKWAINKPNITGPLKLKKNMELEERNWGNHILGKNNSGQWSNLLGEKLIHDVLKNNGENPVRPKRKSGFQPDWETDTHIYEVKTSNWCVNGTAGEKVLGTWIKYQDIPKIYGKPLRIICIANQEYELEYGKINYFGDNISDKNKQILQLAKSWGIEYIKFSDLIKTINCK